MGTVKPARSMCSASSHGNTCFWNLSTTIAYQAMPFTIHDVVWCSLIASQSALVGIAHCAVRLVERFIVLTFIGYSCKQISLNSTEGIFFNKHYLSKMTIYKHPCSAGKFKQLEKDAKRVLLTCHFGRVFGQMSSDILGKFFSRYPVYQSFGKKESDLKITWVKILTHRNIEANRQASSSVHRRKKLHNS